MANKRFTERIMDLSVVEIGQEYIIRDVKTDDEDMNAFLFSLGCYAGEKITVVARRSSGLVVAIKDARYHIDKQLAKAIKI